MTSLHYSLHTQDWSWLKGYLPIGRVVSCGGEADGLHPDRQHPDLSRLSFATLLVFLWIVSLTGLARLPSAQSLLFIAAAPLLAGWVQCVKCRLQNRAAPPLLQPYRDLDKLFAKEDACSPIPPPGCSAPRPISSSPPRCWPPRWSR